MSAEPIRFEVTRNAADFRSAVWLNYWHGGGWAWMVGVSALGAVTNYFLAQPWEDPLIEAAVTAAVVGGLIFVLNVIAIFFAAASGAKLPGAFEPVSYALSDEALEVKSSVGSGTTQWINWRKAFENDRLIVIRHRVNLMHILPKRQLSAEQQQKIRDLLRRVLAGRVALKDHSA